MTSSQSQPITDTVACDRQAKGGRTSTADAVPAGNPPTSAVNTGQQVSDAVHLNHAILRRHYDVLSRESLISDDVIKARGYRSVTDAADLETYGFRGDQLRVPTLLVPIYSIFDASEPALYHHRSDDPRVNADGKITKYEFPVGAQMRVDVNPIIHDQVRDHRVPLFITEGCKKADSAITAGLCCISVVGVWNWRGVDQHGGKAALPDWDMIPLCSRSKKPRSVTLVFDSDVMSKLPVHRALQRLSALLTARGAKVQFIYLPDKPDGSKQGLDDFLAAGNTVQDLMKFAADELRPIPEEWEPLLPLDTAEMDPFPIMAMPQALRHMAEEISKTVQIDVSLSAMSVIGVCAAATRGRCYIQVGDTHGAPTTLAILGIAPSASRKSDALQLAAAPLVQAEIEMRNEARPMIQAAQARFDMQMDRLKNLKLRASKEQDSVKAQELMKDAEFLAAGITPPPQEPQLIVDDVTPEAIASLMDQQSDHSMAVISDEGSFFSNLAGRYSSNGAPNLEFVLKALNGYAAPINRKGTGTLFLPRTSLTLLLFVQPLVMEELAKQESFRGKGFLGRLLYVWAPSRIGYRPYANRKVERDARVAYHQTVFRLLGISDPATKEEPALRHVLNIRGDALDEWADLHDRIEVRMRPEGDLAEFTDWAGKLPTQAARLAGIFHLVEHESLQEALETPISRRTIICAGSVIEFLIPHALKTFGRMTESSSMKLIRRIIDWIQRKKLAQFGLRECYRALSNSGTPEDIERAVMQLEAIGHIRQEAIRKEATGRPPKPTYAVHPDLIKRDE